MRLPGDLFAELWAVVVPHEGRVIARPWDGWRAAEYGAIVEALRACDTVDVPEAVQAYVGGSPGSIAISVSTPAERAFVVMCALDEIAQAIHPAMKTRLPGRGTALGGMLSAMRARRFTDGSYGTDASGGQVVPKGHLMPRKRPDDAASASGSDLSHQFAYLSYIPALAHERRLRMLALTPSKFSSPGDRVEAVGLAPIAENPDDLRFRSSARGGRPYLDTEVANFGLGPRMAEAVTHLLDGGAGLIVLPELVATPHGVDQLQTALKARLEVSQGLETPAFIVAGSGPTAEICPDSGRPFNEATLMSASGRILARQRKLHLFNMGAGRMMDCAIAFAPGFESVNHMEDAAPGQDLVVCDLPGLGRVMVLICEDLEQPEPSGAAIALRPDWIITPVLDIAQAVGRWTHTRAIELARRTQSRVVVSCSASLSARVAGAADLAGVPADKARTGLCLDGFQEVRALLVDSAGKSAPAHEVVPWDSASWPKRKVTAT